MAIPTDRPDLDFVRRDRLDRRWLGRRPVCRICREFISDDRCHQVRDGCYCRRCWPRAFLVTLE